MVGLSVFFVQRCKTESKLDISIYQRASGPPLAYHIKKRISRQLRALYRKKIGIPVTKCTFKGTKYNYSPPIYRVSIKWTIFDRKVEKSSLSQVKDDLF